MAREHPAVRAYMADWITADEMADWIDREPFGRTPLATDAPIFATRPDLLEELRYGSNGMKTSRRWS